MSFADLGISFDAYGIGTAILRHKLRVPENQRAYAWRKEHVLQLFEDLTAAFRKPKSPYFLGTIVLTGNDADRLDVTDGQQRLATVSILIAAIRDYLYPRGEQGIKTAQKYTSDYLLQYDEFENEDVPKFILGIDDNDFFVQQNLSLPDSPLRKSGGKLAKSNERLAEAQNIAKEHVGKIISALPEKDRIGVLLDWISFLQSRVVVIVITAPEDVDAYKMFETLNDRGLKASQIDILKNYLFSEAKGKKKEIQPRWSAMVSKIEDYDDDLLLDYVRHFWISKKGHTKASDLADGFKKNITGEKQAADIVAELENTASDYVALLQALDHPGLAALGADTRAAIYTITGLFGIEQIRPLMLAVLKNFSTTEARLAYVKFVSWSVRYLVVGGAGGGTLEKNYGELAFAVTGGSFQTAKQLADKMNGVVPNDIEFQRAFETNTVSKSVLARYYLRSMEKITNGEDHPYLGEFERAESKINLEHIMPETASQAWGVPQELVDANYKRLGILCLLIPKANVKIGNSKYPEKVPIYKDSTFTTTQQVADYSIKEWGVEQIDKRQSALAKLAPKIWKL